MGSSYRIFFRLVTFLNAPYMNPINTPIAENFARLDVSDRTSCKRSSSIPEAGITDKDDEDDDDDGPFLADGRLFVSGCDIRNQRVSYPT